MKEADTKKKKLEYLNKALELEPDNIDAMVKLAKLNAKHPNGLLDALLPSIEKSSTLMTPYFQKEEAALALYNKYEGDAVLYYKKGILTAVFPACSVCAK